MKNYILKNSVQAVKFQKGMEDGWRVPFWGEYCYYNQDFKTKEEALGFIDSNKGYDFLEDEDKEVGDIEYGAPFSIIEASPDNYIMANFGEYVIKKPDGTKEVMNGKVFESLYIEE